MTGPRCGNDRSPKGSYDFAVCKRSRSPSSVIRLAGDRRMPPSPAGGRKGGCGFAGRGGLSLVLLRGAPGSADPTKERCGFVGLLLSSKAHSPIPSPSGGGCRPQGRPERENVAGLRCGNDRSRGDLRTILPFASGHVLPLPSSASRGIGGCHLPPLGEGKDGCGFAGRCGLSLVLLRGAPGSARPTGRGVANLPGSARPTWGDSSDVSRETFFLSAHSVEGNRNVSHETIEKFFPN